MALSLKQVGIRTTFVPDAALFPVMARVDKVLLGEERQNPVAGWRLAAASKLLSSTRASNSPSRFFAGTVAVLASGAVVTVGGASVVAHAAKLFSKPLLVAAPLFKISNMPFFDHYTCNELLPPSAVSPNLAFKPLRRPAFHPRGPCVFFVLTSDGPRRFRAGRRQHSVGQPTQHRLLSPAEAASSS